MKKNKILIPVLMTGMVLSFNVLAEDEEDLTVPSYEHCKNGTASCTEYYNSYYVITDIVDKNNQPVYIDEEKTQQAQKLTVFGPTNSGSSAWSPQFYKYENGMYPTTIPNVTDVEMKGNIVGVGGFRHATNLKNITLSDATTDITQGAFYRATNLESINIPKGVTKIENSTFQDASSLKSITFAPDSELTIINQYAFNGTALESISIPDKVTQIGDSAFKNVSSLKSVDFGQNSKLETIWTGAFYGTGIESITIPDTVKNIGQRAFQGCTSLKDITIPDNATIWSMAFSGVNATNLTVSEDQLKAYLGTGSGNLKLNDSGKLNIICTKGDCEKYLREESKYKTNTALLAGLKVVPLRLEKELADGSIAIYEMGVLKGYKNKRIYTVEEAAAVSKKTGNTFRLRYK